MKQNFLYLFLSLFLVSLITAQGQDTIFQKYIVKPARFSSGIFDEFSPVFFGKGLVFCSNRNDNSPVSYNDGNKRLYKIFYTEPIGANGWKKAKLLEGGIRTPFNDGPASLTAKGDLMFFSRNLNSGKNVRNYSDTTNRLGIFSAKLINGIWTDIQPFNYNNQNYSLTTPSITYDGNRLYFASDMPGGYGGFDIYYCDKNSGEWSKPINLGSTVNTKRNESFPFISGFGKLFFSSDGLSGFGGKDIFYTQQINGRWIDPVHLDSAINSPFDDFGIVVDSTSRSGYFSTNRRRTDDIFSFTVATEEFSSCDSIRTNRYCFTLYDEKYQAIDTIPVIYKWDFGNGIIRTGTEVKYCFPGEGKYRVRLDILDKLTGDTIAGNSVFNVELENYSQPLIISETVWKADKPMNFEGILTDLKGANITDFFWDFGEGFKPGGSEMSHTFRKKGEYEIKMGLLEAKDENGKIKKWCVVKKIRIV